MKFRQTLFFLFITCFGFSQQTEYVDFKKAKAEIFFADLTKKDVNGVVSYQFEILKDIDSVCIDAVKMEFNHVYLGDNKTDFFNDEKKIVVKHDFKEGQTYNISFNYKVNPKKAMYFIDWGNSDAVSLSNFNENQNQIQNKQIWTQGQGKYTSHWLPSLDDTNDKIEFDLSITFNKSYQVIANGNLINKQINTSTITWHYDMEEPMSSYLVAFAIGKYSKKVVHSKRGMPLEFYYYPEDSLKFEPTYRYTKQMFDFLEEEIGVPYPWQNYKQVPVKDFLYAGMENTSTTIFSDALVVDSIAFVDKNYVNVNAHELAHQWFGDLVTAKSGEHHWLQEGFATYYALLAERDVFGDDYYYWRLYEYAQELLEQDKAGGSTSLLNPKSSSTTFYKKGAWVLHLLRELIGDKAFKAGVVNYLKKHQFKNVETDDFIGEVEKTSKQDLSEFVNTWLFKETFDYEYLIANLKTNPFISEYLNINYEGVDSKCDFSLDSNISDQSKSKIIKLVPKKVSKETFKNDVKVRQAIAQNLTEIPLELKEDYESLLNDASYITIETALYNLWSNFPKERHKYFNKTKDVQGFNDKNVRILWLTLALVTPDFEPENKPKYLKELTDYTNPEYNSGIRQNAFLYLLEIQACNTACKANLKQATKHHDWRFSKFAKAALKE